MDPQFVPRPRPAGWIISPVADIALLVATPLAILPAVTLAARHLSTDLIVLYVAAFASIGHHLPGFMRAYGDRVLFRRFRWRFLVAPPLVLAVALSFAWRDMHGLEMIMLVWATWHIIMQTYGLMRIYDLKRGIRDTTTARLDFAVCVAIFVGGIVLSQSRMFAILQLGQRIGIPLGPPALAIGLRWAAGGAIVALVVGYLVHAWRQSRIEGATWAKLALLCATGWLYWSCGSLSTNLLIGVAMFEIFHAVQYYAIVWSYNHRLVGRDANRLGRLKFLFADGWLPLAMYAAAIAAFGSIRLVSGGLDPSPVSTLLLALLLTSTAMHFYFDGFIWKVSESSIQQNLGIEGQGLQSATATARVHAIKWGGLAAIAAGLFWFEAMQTAPSVADQRAWFAAASMWTPDVPELLLPTGRFALADGDSTVALAAAWRLADVRPESAETQVLLARAEVANRNLPAADKATRRAVALAPDSADAQLLLARAEVVKRNLPAAAAAARRAVALAPGSAEANSQLGLIGLQLSDYATAEGALQRSIDADPSCAEAHLQLGNVYFLTHRLDLAERSFRRAAELSPHSADAYGNLGAVLMQQGRVKEAKEALLAALANGDNPQCHSNLGWILLTEGSVAEARTHFRRAEALGQAISPEVRRAAGL